MPNPKAEVGLKCRRITTAQSGIATWLTPGRSSMCPSAVERRLTLDLTRMPSLIDDGSDKPALRLSFDTNRIFEAAGDLSLHGGVPFVGRIGVQVTYIP
jgi:hypothetical protein